MGIAMEKSKKINNWSSIVVVKKILTNLKNLKQKLPWFNPPLYASEIWAHFNKFFRSKLKNYVVFFTFFHCNSHCNYWPLEQLVSVGFFLDFLNNYNPITTMDRVVAWLKHKWVSTIHHWLTLWSINSPNISWLSTGS